MGETGACDCWLLKFPPFFNFVGDSFQQTDVDQMGHLALTPSLLDSVSTGLPCQIKSRAVDLFGLVRGQPAAGFGAASPTTTLDRGGL